MLEIKKKSKELKKCIKTHRTYMVIQIFIEIIFIINEKNKNICNTTEIIYIIY